MIHMIAAALAFVLRPLISFLITWAPKIVGSILVYLGFGFVSYQFVNIGIDSFISYINSTLSNVPVESLIFVHLLGLDIYLSLIVAAYAVLFQIKLMAFIGSFRQVSKPKFLGI